MSARIDSNQGPEQILQGPSSLKPNTEESSIPKIASESLQNPQTGVPPPLQLRGITVINSRWIPEGLLFEEFSFRFNQALEKIGMKKGGGGLSAIETAVARTLNSKLNILSQVVYSQYSKSDQNLSPIPLLEIPKAIVALSDEEQKIAQQFAADRFEEFITLLSNQGPGTSSVQGAIPGPSGEVEEAESEDTAAELAEEKSQVIHPQISIKEVSAPRVSEEISSSSEVAAFIIDFLGRNVFQKETALAIHQLLERKDKVEHEAKEREEKAQKKAEQEAENIKADQKRYEQLKEAQLQDLKLKGLKRSQAGRSEAVTNENLGIREAISKKQAGEIAPSVSPPISMENSSF